MRATILPIALCLSLAACDRPAPPALGSKDVFQTLADGVVLANFVDAGDDETAWRRAEGWHAPTIGSNGERAGWTESTRATMQLPWNGADGAAAQLLLRISCEADDGPERELRIGLNETLLHRGPAPPRYETLAIDVPADLLRGGENLLVLGIDRTVTRGARQLGMLVDFVGLRSPGAEPIPRQDPTENHGQRLTLSENRSIRCRPAELSERQLLLRCFSEFLPETARIHVRLPEAGSSWEDFEGPVIDRKAEFFVRFPADLPPNTPLELQLTGAGDAELKIVSAKLLGKFDARNVVLLVVDTLRADYLGCYGHPTAETPNLDALAEDGVLFENAFAHSPITAPSHASLLQSQTPSELGIVNNHRRAIPDDLPTITELLRPFGYDTAAVVSIDPIRKKFGYNRGFDTYDARMGSNWIVAGEIIRERALEQLSELRTPFFFWTHFSDPHEPYDAHGLAEKYARILLDGKEIGRVETTKYTSTEIDVWLPLRESTLRIESDRPFFLRRVGIQGPAWKRPKLSNKARNVEAVRSYETKIAALGDRNVTIALSVHDEYEEGTLLERYEREVEFVDRQIGAILDSLRAEGLYQDSWIVFTSDHGEGLGCHGITGHVQNLYDCLVHVPLIIKPPSSSPIEVGRRRADLCSLIDVAPTLLENLGLSPPKSMRGEDLFARDEGARTDVAVFLETHAPQADHTKFALRTRQQKIIWTPELQLWELYDLETDPDEEHDLCGGAAPESKPIYSRFQEALSRIHASAQERGAEMPLDEETTEILRSLGYVQ